MPQSIDEQIGLFATIETEAHFFEIGCKMLRADFVPRSHNAALQERECGLNCVCVNVSHDVDAVAVFNGFVPRSWNSGSLHYERIRREIIRQNHVNVLADVFSNKTCNRSRFHIASMEYAKLAIALTDADYNLFSVPRPVSPYFLEPGLALPPTWVSSISTFPSSVGF